MTAARPRGRRKRTLTAQLAAIVLGFEAIVVFLGGLAVFGLKAVPPGNEPWWGIVGGTVVALLMLVTSGLVHTRAGIVTGWALQLVVALSAFLVPAMLLIALIFGGMWAFAAIQGPRIEARASRAAPEGE